MYDASLIDRYRNTSLNEYTQLLDHHTVSLNELYSEHDNAAFQRRFADFLSSDLSHSQIMTMSSESLNYLSESYTPPVIYNDKKNLILILGNPAPDSVAMQAMYAYEGNKGRYHRFWRVMHHSGVLQFSQDPDTIDPHEKMRRLYTMDYTSPFNIHIIPFYSLPTPPGGAWGGVAGIRKLFGAAFARVEAMELQRKQQYFAHYLKDDDHILVFQKDAHLALGSTQTNPPEYNYRSLLTHPARSKFVGSSGAAANLLCMLPTRLLHAQSTKNALQELAQSES